MSYPGVINPNKLVPLLPKKTKFNNSLRAALLMDSYICIQWEFLAFFLAMFAIFRSQHIWQLCPGECLNCFPFNLNSWKYDSNAIPVWNMRRRWDMSEITCRHISDPQRNMKYKKYEIWKIWNLKNMKHEKYEIWGEKMRWNMSEILNLSKHFSIHIHKETHFSSSSTFNKSN